MKIKLWVIPVAVALAAFVVPAAWAAPLSPEPPGTLDQLSQVIGALGLFAAMMAVLALGTEVIIDTLKLVVGLKRKPTTLEALRELGDKLPGRLNDLGLTTEASQQVRTLVDNLSATLQPVQQAQDITAAARRGDLQAAFQKLDELTGLTGSQNVSQMQAALGAQLNSGLATILGRLEIPDAQKSAIIKGVADAAGQLQGTQATQLLLARLRDASAQVIQAWMLGQEQTLIASGRESVMGLFHDQVVPELKMLGLDDAAIEVAQKQLNGQLEQLSTRASLYLASVRELVQAVENRRVEMQSPLRKLWRKLREYPIVGHGISWFKAAGFPGGCAGLLTWPEALVNWALRRQPSQGTELGQAATVPALAPTNLAHYLMITNNQQQDEETSRLRILRVISVLVGIYLAYLLQVNALDLLAKSAAMFQGLANINEKIVTTQRVVEWLGPLWLLMKQTGLATLIPRAPSMELNAGILLSGLAASAGSAFWHDQLERLQVAKKAVGQVEKVIETIRQPVQE